ncbi:MAG: hypothetical protein OHK0032_09600 [Thermodesulfovibrionales bacterium]
MIEAKIDLPNVLKRMTRLRTELDEIIEELEILSNPRIRKQIEESLKAEKEGKTKKYTLTGLKRAMGLE